MIYQTIHLNTIFEGLKDDPVLRSYCPDNYQWSLDTKRPCVVLLPGGGYNYTSSREAEPVALRLVGQDIAVFILDYTTMPNMVYPQPFVEVFAAVAYVRQNAPTFNVDANKICVMGFSAGGHLAAGSSAFCNDADFANMLGVDAQDMQINACLLGYPVISYSFPHLGTFQNISRGDDQLAKQLSIERCVTPNYPKTFIWHTTYDHNVSSQNSLILATELVKNGVFMELHLYPVGEHGLSLCDESTITPQILDKAGVDRIRYNGQWVDNAVHFIKNYV